jgi:hypothetical protein
VEVESGEAIQVTGAGETVLNVAATVDGRVAVGTFGSGLWLTQDGSGEADSIVWQKPEVALHAPPVISHVSDMIYALDVDGWMGHSPDGGSSWLEMESASPGSVFALDAARGDTLFAATETGIAAWNREAQRWQEVANDSFQATTVLGVELSPFFDSDQTLLATTQESRLFLSQDSGNSWHEITGAWRGHNLLHAHFAADSADEIVAVTALPNESGHFDIAVWHSVDLGKHWDTLAGLSSGVPAVVVAWPHDPEERALFLATQHRVIKLYHHSDPLTLHVHQHFFDEHLRVTALATAPDYVQSQIVWAATSGGLYRSVDRGQSWGLMSDLPLDLPVVWLDVTFTHISVITLGGRVWRAAL